MKQRVYILIQTKLQVQFTLILTYVNLHLTLFLQSIAYKIMIRPTILKSKIEPTLDKKKL